jgi:hypothetical protein
MDSVEMELEVAVFEDEDRTGLSEAEHRWIARSLRFEIFGVGDTPRDALSSFVAALEAEREFARAAQREPFIGLPTASPKFVAWWETVSKRKLEVAPTMVSNVPEPWMIRAMERELVTRR